MSNLGAQPATMGGQASRISAKQPMSQEDLRLSLSDDQRDALDAAVLKMQAQGGSLSAVVHVKRKDTGVVETHNLTFTPIKEQ